MNKRVKQIVKCDVFERACRAISMTELSKEKGDTDIDEIIEAHNSLVWIARTALEKCRAIDSKEETE